MTLTFIANVVLAAITIGCLYLLSRGWKYANAQTEQWIANYTDECNAHNITKRALNEAQEELTHATETLEAYWKVATDHYVGTDAIGDTRTAHADRDSRYGGTRADVAKDA